MTKPWKWDVTIYDRPGWYTISDNHKQLYLSPSGRLGLRIWSSPAALTATDFWKEQFDNRVLVSDDGGMSWRTGTGSDVPPRRSVRTASGRIVSILSSEVLQAPEDRKRHLESVGLGHLYSDTTFYQYGLWPESMRDEVAGMGLLVHEVGNGVIGAHTGQTLRISEDDGKTWKNRELTEFPYHAKMIGFFRDPVITPSGTIVGACDGIPNPERGPAEGLKSVDHCLRSEDDGDTWELIPVGVDPEGVREFAEPQVALLPSGRIIMMMRSAAGEDDRHIYQSFSEDDGKTWTPAERTPMWGKPPNPVVLRSGALLCSYAYRREPFGIRACVSYDEGATWDIANEKIIRDDAVTGRISYPTAVQLEDESVFAFYGINKACEPLPEEQKISGDNIRVYLAGSRFHQDWVRSEPGR